MGRAGYAQRDAEGVAQRPDVSESECLWAAARHVVGGDRSAVL